MDSRQLSFDDTAVEAEPQVSHKQQAEPAAAHDAGALPTADPGFDVGDRVRVVRGRHDGKRGTIVRVMDHYSGPLYDIESGGRLLRRVQAHELGTRATRPTKR